MSIVQGISICNKIYKNWILNKRKKYIIKVFVEEKNSRYSQKRIRAVPPLWIHTGKDISRFRIKYRQRQPHNAWINLFTLKLRILCFDWLQPLRQSWVTLRAYLDWFMIFCENSQGFYRLYRRNYKVEKPYWENQSELVKT